MGVDVGTGANVGSRASDRPAITTYGFARADVANRELVTARDGIEQRNRGSTDLGVLTLRKIAKGNCDVIIRRDDQGNRRSAEGG